FFQKKNLWLSYDGDINYSDRVSIFYCMGPSYVNSRYWTYIEYVFCFDYDDDCRTYWHYNFQLVVYVTRRRYSLYDTNAFLTRVHTIICTWRCHWCHAVRFGCGFSIS